LKNFLLETKKLHFLLADDQFVNVCRIIFCGSNFAKLFDTIPFYLQTNVIE